MKNSENYPHILDSKIKKLRIELPHYSFSHSSLEESHHFVGRKQIQKKLKKLVETTPTDRTGVYLVTGNRGVGKTSLVNQVINQTSFQTNSSFFKNLKDLFMLFLSVVGADYCLKKFNITPSECPIVLFIVIFLFISLFMIQGVFNGYRKRKPKQKLNKNEIWNCIKSAVHELIYFSNQHNRYRSTQYLLKIIWAVCSTQLLYLITFRHVTPTLAFCIFLILILFVLIRKFCVDKWREYKGTPKNPFFLFFKSRSPFKTIFQMV